MGQTKKLSVGVDQNCYTKERKEHNVLLLFYYYYFHYYLLLASYISEELHLCCALKEIYFNRPSSYVLIAIKINIVCCTVLTFNAVFAEPFIASY
jgi:hypothetical protein